MLLISNDVLCAKGLASKFAMSLINHFLTWAKSIFQSCMAENFAKQIILAEQFQVNQLMFVHFV